MDFKTAQKSIYLSLSFSANIWNPFVFGLSYWEEELLWCAWCRKEKNKNGNPSASQNLSTLCFPINSSSLQLKAKTKKSRITLFSFLSQSCIQIICFKKSSIQTQHLSLHPSLKHRASDVKIMKSAGKWPERNNCLLILKPCWVFSSWVFILFWHSGRA